MNHAIKPPLEEFAATFFGLIYMSKYQVSFTYPHSHYNETSLSAILIPNSKHVPTNDRSKHFVRSAKRVSTAQRLLYR